MAFIRANLDDFSRIEAFYRYVIAHTEHMELYTHWVYGQHPSPEMIVSYIQKGYLYFSEENGQITAAAAVVPYQEEDYHSIRWAVDAEDDEAAVIHILCADPAKKHRGIAGGLIADILRTARLQNKKAVRLDTFASNLPAQKLYESMGFKKCGTENRQIEGSMWIDFFFYEYIC